MQHKHKYSFILYALLFKKKWNSHIVTYYLVAFKLILVSTRLKSKVEYLYKLYILYNDEKRNKSKLPYMIDIQQQEKGTYLDVF